MNNPLHAPFFADQAIQRVCTVARNVAVAESTLQLRFRCPELAQLILPGQFVMLRLSGCDDPLIGRPFAMYDVVATQSGGPVDGIDIVYVVAGKLTTKLSTLLPGHQLDVWGPLGNGFRPQSCDHLLMVAGGIGQTPFLAVVREHLGLQRFGCPPRCAARVPRVTLCYGNAHQGVAGWCQRLPANRRGGPHFDR